MYFEVVGPCKISSLSIFCSPSVIFSVLQVFTFLLDFYSFKPAFKWKESCWSVQPFCCCFDHGLQLFRSSFSFWWLSFSRPKDSSFKVNSRIVQEESSGLWNKVCSVQEFCFSKCRLDSSFVSTRDPERLVNSENLFIC